MHRQGLFGGFRKRGSLALGVAAFGAVLAARYATVAASPRNVPAGANARPVQALNHRLLLSPPVPN